MNPPGKTSPEARRRALEAFARRHELKIARWAAKADIPPNAIYSFLNGHSDDMGASTYQALARAANASVDELLCEPDDLQDRILKAATPLFAASDFDQISMTDIAEAAGIGPVAVSSVYPRKRDVLYDIMAQLNKERLVIFDDPPDPEMFFVENIFYIFKRTLEHDFRRKRTLQSYMSEAWGHPPSKNHLVHSTSREFWIRFISILSNAQNDGLIDTFDEAVVLQLFRTIYIQALRDAFVRNLDVDKALAGIKPKIQLLMRGLGYKDI